jgi:hypothetical protein
MVMNQRLDRTTIEKAFRVMGQYLLERRTLGEIAIYGGSAILFQFDWRKTSFDVDARVISNHGHVIDAVHEAARVLGLPQSWLSESVAMYARRQETDADRILVGLYPSPVQFGLRVTAARPAYLLAMKLKALERATANDRDFHDAIWLGIECGTNTVEGLTEVFGKFFGPEQLPLSAEPRLDELARAIRAKVG